MPRRSLIVLVSALALAVSAGATDWPHLRGPSLDGTAVAPAGLGEQPGLELAWRVPLGLGYSGVAVADGKVVTLFTQGDSDWVAAFELASGEELWRHRLDSANPARDGSAGGPISSPIIRDDLVFALGPKGQLLALELASGEVRWSRAMEADFGAAEPDFGHGMTPVLVGERLILLTISESEALLALDPASGEKVWGSGSGQYRYQIPVTVEVDGKPQVVTAAGRLLIGFDAGDGAVLWTHELGERERISAPLTASGDGRFLTFVNGAAALFSVSAAGDGYEVAELYRSDALGAGYALPVYHDGHFYGFRGQILTCMNAESGERVWRSRPPGGRGLILVGDHLAIFGGKGTVVLAEATPEGYVEVSRVRALDASGYTWPSFADGHVLVRNLEELTAVRLGSASAASADEVAEAGGALGALLGEIAVAEDKQQVVDDFWAGLDRLPLVEGERVHFLYRGEATDMAVVGTMTPTGAAEEMTRVAGTDLFYRSFDLEPAGRWEYRFIRDYSERLIDPENPRSVPARQGGSEVSEIALPGYEAADHLLERDMPRGRLELQTFESETLGIGRRVHVYLPPGYDESDERYPLLIVHDGGDWVEKGLMPTSLDNLVGRRVRPVVVAFLEVRDQWWLEAGGTETGEHVEMLVGELLPLLEEKYRLLDDPGSRALMGNTGFGLTSAYAALKHPELFGKVAIQSPQLTLGFEGPLMELIERRPPADVDFYLDWSRYEVRDLDEGIDLSRDSQRLAEALEGGGYDLTGGEVLDSAGWSGWRSRTDRILESLFPLQ
jgi:enterochelin esterase-like enzyme/outer membrane protein assembly factor BamB